MRNHVKESLKEGKVALGAWMSILNPDSARAVAGSGIDWVLFDTEHGPASFETVDQLVRSASGLGGRRSSESSGTTSTRSSRPSTRGPTAWSCHGSTPGRRPRTQ